MAHVGFFNSRKGGSFYASAKIVQFGIYYRPVRITKTSFSDGITVQFGGTAGIVGCLHGVYNPRLTPTSPPPDTPDLARNPLKSQPLAWIQRSAPKPDKREVGRESTQAHFGNCFPRLIFRVWTGFSFPENLGGVSIQGV